jgi:hypothetical protein
MNVNLVAASPGFDIPGKGIITSKRFPLAPPPSSWALKLLTLNGIFTLLRRYFYVLNPI